MIPYSLIAINPYSWLISLPFEFSILIASMNVFSPLCSGHIDLICVVDEVEEEMKGVTDSLRDDGVVLEMIRGIIVSESKFIYSIIYIINVS